MLIISTWYFPDKIRLVPWGSETGTWGYLEVSSFHSQKERKWREDWYDRASTGSTNLPSHKKEVSVGETAVRQPLIDGNSWFPHQHSFSSLPSGSSFLSIPSNLPWLGFNLQHGN